ncbi:MAG: hypothetical protein WBL35_11795 [Ornithinibacter sp.]
MSDDHEQAPARDGVDRVRFAGGVSERDRDLVADTLSQVISRFEHVDRAWEMELSVKDRDAPGMVTTLEAWIPGRKRLVATSQEADLRAGLNDCGDDLLRQFTRDTDRRTPMANRARRDTIRGS